MFFGYREEILKTSEGARKAWELRNRAAGKISYGKKLPQIHPAGISMYDGDVPKVREQLKKAGFKPILRNGGYESHSNGEEVVLLNPNGRLWTVARTPVKK